MRFLPDLPYDISGEERRKLGPGRPAKQIPEQLVIFAFHILHQIELSAPLKVAFGKAGKTEHLHFGRFEKTFKLPDAGRVAHFTQSLRFDLPDTLASDPKLAAHFFECAAVSVD